MVTERQKNTAESARNPPCPAFHWLSLVYRLLQLPFSIIDSGHLFDAAAGILDVWPEIYIFLLYQLDPFDTESMRREGFVVAGALLKPASQSS
jgi:hypothetical protein